VIAVTTSIFSEFRPFALSIKGSENRKYTQRLEMLTHKNSGVVAMIAFAIFLVVVVASRWRQPKAPVAPGPVKSRCAKLLTRTASGSLRLDTGEEFPDMKTFQQWWHTTNAVRCPIPILQGPVGEGEGEGEQMWATTPINKLDDYEFSRVFGYEKGGHMIVPRQDFNLILEKRSFDWADLPMTSSEREGKYRGMVEGFTASGELGSTSVGPLGPTSLQEARSRFNPDQTTVEELVQNAYKDDPDWTPVLTRIGPNQWEVNTLNPRRSRAEAGKPGPVETARLADAHNNAVDVQFQYRQKEDMNTALGPHIDTVEHLPDYRGRMELPFAPTTEHPGDWSIKSPSWM